MTHTTLRNRHDRLEHHTGDLPATLVGLSSGLDIDLPVGMTLEEALAIIEARINALEGRACVLSWFSLDAVIA
jgi:hypothetical protein